MSDGTELTQSVVPRKRPRERRADYVANPVPCAHCAKPLSYAQAKHQNGRFCSVVCSRIGSPPPRASDSNRPSSYTRREKRRGYEVDPTPCLQCGAPLSYKQHYKEANTYCSPECRRASDAGAQTYLDILAEMERGQNVETLRAQKVDCHCGWCGGPFSDTQLDRDARFLQPGVPAQGVACERKRSRKEGTGHQHRDLLQEPTSMLEVRGAGVLHARNPARLTHLPRISPP